MYNNNYRTPEEMKYYGSDLNKFVDKNCFHEMTVNNMDLLIYKRSKKHIRIIESKHISEGAMEFSQKEVLKILSTAQFSGYIFEVFIVIGDPPDYEPVTIIDIIKSKIYKIKEKQDFIDWLEFKKELCKCLNLYYL